ncbi:hypothetical protein F4561_000255 [Lipingzhangella halophila]|uniref:Hint domain-containing protein n=1 Tax=Lipingzhangella halophila TaxID=1783352 RepID=A0A7W7RCP4_9ACTN|nr:polymorphic toxin-type HINT domain-containing protein [Lipingzhangella halophila]MBB4929435.1 hypothetical protein [Lipingzhangella halophila]
MLGSGITGRVTGMVEDAITSVGTPGNGSGPQAGGEHGDEQQHDTPGGDQQPATPQADPDNDNDDEGEGGGGGGPLGSMPTLDTDLGPGSGSGESFAPLGVDNLLAGPPSAGLTPTYSTGDLRDDIADLADDAAESQARATREGLEMAEETIRGPIDLAQDLREDAPGTLRRGAENAIAGATELHNEYAATVRDSAELIRQGFDDGEYLSGLWDGASHLATWNLSQSAQLAISEEGYEHFANGEFEQGLVRSTANAASWLIGGPALKGLTKLPNGTGRNPDPDPDPEPDSHHLADGETDSQGQNRDEDDTDEPNGNCRTNSFTPGTPVLMADGSTTPIQDIQTGDEILAFDPATGEEGPREVTDTITGDGQKTLVDITVTDTDGTTSTLTATDEHPFWAPKAGQWVDATDLTPGTWLRTSAGTWTQTTAVDTNTVDDQQFHNLTIDDLQTYYVEVGGSTALVHNQTSGYQCQPNENEDEALQRLEWEYETEVSQGVGHMFDELDAGKADHKLAGIDTVDDLAAFLDRNRGAGTHTDASSNRSVSYHPNMRDDKGRGVIVVEGPVQIHAYHMSQDTWNERVRDDDYLEQGNGHGNDASGADSGEGEN